jgi:hypothetical protein
MFPVVFFFCVACHDSNYLESLTMFWKFGMVCKQSYQKTGEKNKFVQMTAGLTNCLSLAVVSPGFPVLQFGNIHESTMVPLLAGGFSAAMLASQLEQRLM